MTLFWIKHDKNTLLLCIFHKSFFFGIQKSSSIFSITKLTIFSRAQGFKKLFQIRILQKFFGNSNTDPVRAKISIKQVTKKLAGYRESDNSFGIRILKQIFWESNPYPVLVISLKHVKNLAVYRVSEKLYRIRILQQI